MDLASDVRAVLFDRDATLVVDVPYNGDPALVEPMPGAVDAVRLAREAGLAIGVVSNQSGIGRGLITRAQVDAVNARVDEMFGGFDVWAYCPHTAEDRCACRKPEPGLVVRACRTLGVAPAQAVVIGDIGADMGAAERAGARGILVPTPITRFEEVAAAPVVARGILEAVALVVEAAPSTSPTGTAVS